MRLFWGNKGWGWICSSLGNWEIITVLRYDHSWGKTELKDNICMSKYRGEHLESWNQWSIWCKSVNRILMDRFWDCWVLKKQKGFVWKKSWLKFKLLSDEWVICLAQRNNITIKWYSCLKPSVRLCWGWGANMFIFNNWVVCKINVRTKKACLPNTKLNGKNTSGLELENGSIC